MQYVCGIWAVKVKRNQQKLLVEMTSFENKGESNNFEEVEGVEIVCLESVEWNGEMDYWNKIL